MKLLMIPASGLAVLCPMLTAQVEAPQHARVSIAASAQPAVLRDLAPSHAVLAADTTSPGPEKKEFRVRRVTNGPVEKETVTFLGVEAGMVSPTLVAQLDLPNGTGLVVLRVEPESAAATVLKEHDILLKLDDQILVDQRQLSVLIRNHKAGDEVTLTYVRGGKQATAKVKLTTHEVPKFKEIIRTLTIPGLGEKGQSGRLELHEKQGAVDREQADHLLGMIERERNGMQPIRIERSTRGLSVSGLPGSNRAFVYSDDNGTVEYTVTPKEKTLVAKDTQGHEVFSGPVTTDEQRKALAPEIRERLDKVESMQNVTFRTDGDFKSAETRIMEPEGQPIAFPNERGAKSSDGLRTL